MNADQINALAKEAMYCLGFQTPGWLAVQALRDAAMLTAAPSPQTSAQEPDVPDIIAGALQCSRAYACTLIERALAERNPQTSASVAAAENPPLNDWQRRDVAVALALATPQPQPPSPKQDVQGREIHTSGYIQTVKPDPTKLQWDEYPSQQDAQAEYHAWCGDIDDEATLRHAVSVMEDVLGDIGGWEDTALAEAVTEVKRDLGAMADAIQMRAPTPSPAPGAAPPVQWDAK